MRLFGLGVIWTIYAAFVLTWLQVYIEKNPEKVISIGPSAKYGSSAAWRRADVAYERQVEQECAAWTRVSLIGDNPEKGVTYRTECSSLSRALFLNIMAIIVTIVPVVLLAASLRKKAK